MPSHIDKPLPRNTIAQICKQSEAGQTQALEALNKRAHTLKAAVVQGLIRSVASGIRCWHMFACNLRHYGEKTLPITCAWHVLQFVGIFSNAGTAANYITYLRYVHKFFTWPCEHWDTGKVKMAVKGLNRLNLIEYGGPAAVRFLLTEDHTQLCARFFITLAKTQLALCIMASWEFFLRVQSEGFHMVKGEMSDSRELKSGDRCMFIDSDRLLHCRLRKRKQSQNSSDLRAACRCHDPSNRCRAFGKCLRCTFASHIESIQPGEPLWCFRLPCELSKMKEALTVLGIPGAENLSFKSWRAGRAIAMAKAGLGLADILTAGEWKAMASARHCHTDHLIITTVGILDSTLQREADEVEDGVPDECQ